MNRMTVFGSSVSAWWKRPRAPHQPHPALWVLTAVVLALLGTAAAFVRNLDDEPKLVLGTRVLGHVGSLLVPQPAASAIPPAALPLPLQRR